MKPLDELQHAGTTVVGTRVRKSGGRRTGYVREWRRSRPREVLVEWDDNGSGDRRWTWVPLVDLIAVEWQDSLF